MFSPKNQVQCLHTLALIIIRLYFMCRLNTCRCICMCMLFKYVQVVCPTFNLQLHSLGYVSLNYLHEYFMLQAYLHLILLCPACVKPFNFTF